jgi:hypothetical protein
MAATPRTHAHPKARDFAATAHRRYWHEAERFGSATNSSAVLGYSRRWLSGVATGKDDPTRTKLLGGHRCCLVRYANYSGASKLVISFAEHTTVSRHPLFIASDQTLVVPDFPADLIPANFVAGDNHSHAMGGALGTHTAGRTPVGWLADVVGWPPFRVALTPLGLGTESECTLLSG